MESRPAIEASSWRVSARALPRLSPRAGFCALAVLSVTASSTTPSGLYGLYEHREHLSSLAITIVSLAGLLVARVLTGLALGAAVATATAFITDLGGGAGDAALDRAGTVATIANIGGLAVGPLIAGLLARYAAHPLTLPFVVLLAALVVGAVVLILAPEGRHPSAAEVSRNKLMALNRTASPDGDALLLRRRDRGP